MKEEASKMEKNIPDEPAVFVPDKFIRDFEQIIEKLETSRREFSKAMETLEVIKS